MSQLSILTEKERTHFDACPILTDVERKNYFTLDPILENVVARFNSDSNKLGFILQLGYFRKKGRFFEAQLYHEDDIAHLATARELAITMITTKNYPKETQRRHRNLILEHLQWNSFNQKEEQQLMVLVEQHVKLSAFPHQLFELCVAQLWQQKVEIPSYAKLNQLITFSYRQVEKHYLQTLKDKLSTTQKKKLNALLLPEESERDKKLARPVITTLKKINQGLNPKAITENVETFDTIKQYIGDYKTIIDQLAVPDKTLQYYANWVEKASAYQLRTLSNQYKRYFHLLLYLKHQYFYRHDILVDCFLRVSQSAKNIARTKVNDSRAIKKTTQREDLLTVLHDDRDANDLINTIESLVKTTVLTMPEKLEQIDLKIEQFRQEQDNHHSKKLEGITSTVNIEKDDLDYFDMLELGSIRFQRRATPLIKSLHFDDHYSEKTLLEAIHYFQHRDGDIDAKAPLTFLSKKEYKAVTKNKGFRLSLYKALLFLHVAKGIKAGRLNLAYSYRYRGIHSYLIDEKRWEKERSVLLTASGLSELEDCNTVLEQLQQKLEKKYQTFNQKLKKNKLPLINTDKAGIVHVKTPKVDNDDMKYISGLLEEQGITSILQVLEDVNSASYFTGAFKHSSIKHFKMKPVPALVHAGLIGRGCNVGVSKMANISIGISEDKLNNLVNWCFSLENIQTANDKIVSMIDQLALPNIFRYEQDSLHTSSDGRKVPVGVESLAATYSFKYFGKDKGVSVYTFIDERQILFSSSVFSSSERDAAYVIDGLMHNDVIKSSIHSTDTHGFTDAVFAATHLLDIAYAPRLKGSARRTLYGFLDPKYYKKQGWEVCPKSKIQKSLIKDQWDNVLRFVASIKLHEASASQLFKRLNSYGADHPLYKALKEFGKIVRSHFLLTYYDDMKLRQRIELQLNRIEMANRFGRAIFFANNEEFQHGLIDAQKISTACQVLLQNAITLWNYLYLSRYLLACKVDERDRIIALMKRGSIMNWAHINLQGEYDFRKVAVNHPSFNIGEILKLKIA